MSNEHVPSILKGLEGQGDSFLAEVILAGLKIGIISQDGDNSTDPGELSISGEFDQPTTPEDMLNGMLSDNPEARDFYVSATLKPLLDWEDHYIADGIDLRTELESWLDRESLVGGVAKRYKHRHTIRSHREILTTLFGKDPTVDPDYALALRLALLIDEDKAARGEALFDKSAQQQLFYNDVLTALARAIRDKTFNTDATNSLEASKTPDNPSPNPVLQILAMNPEQRFKLAREELIEPVARLQHKRDRQPRAKKINLLDMLEDLIPYKRGRLVQYARANSMHPHTVQPVRDSVREVIGEDKLNDPLQYWRLRLLLFAYRQAHPERYNEDKE